MLTLKRNLGGIHGGAKQGYHRYHNAVVGCKKQHKTMITTEIIEALHPNVVSQLKRNEYWSNDGIHNRNTTSEGSQCGTSYKNETSFQRQLQPCILKFPARKIAALCVSEGNL